MYQVEELKSKNFLIYNSNYRFKEDWVLQAFLLKMKTALEWIEFIDANYPNKVKVNRESYICEQKRVFTGPAGLKLEFSDKKTAQYYCDTLNKALKEFNNE